jgi:hypothetical protein
MSRLNLRCWQAPDVLKSMNADADNQWIVVKDGKRASKILTEEEALTEAKKLEGTVVESEGQVSPKVEIKKNLFG